MNERFLFLPSLALSMVAVWILWKFFRSTKPMKKILTAVFFGAVGLGFMWITLQRIPDWKNTMSINQSAVKISKNSARANLFYGVALWDELMKSENDSVKNLMLREAEKYNDRALQIYPEYSNALKMKAGYAAELWKIDRNLPELLREFEEVLSVKPEPFVEEFVDYLLPRSDKSLLVPFLYRAGYEHLGREQNKFTEALNYLAKGYSLDSQDPNILFGLCVISNQVGEYSNAIRYGEQFLSIHGKNALVLYFTGNALIKTNMNEKGNQYMDEAYQLQPDLRSGIAE